MIVARTARMLHLTGVVHHLRVSAVSDDAVIVAIERIDVEESAVLWPEDVDALHAFLGDVIADRARRTNRRPPSRWRYRPRRAATV